MLLRGCSRIEEAECPSTGRETGDGMSAKIRLPKCQSSLMTN